MLSVPYSLGILPIVLKYKDHINDVYFSDGRFDSARNDENFQTHSLDEIKSIKNAGISVNYVFNPPIIKNSDLNDNSDILNYLMSLSDYVDSITINNLLLLTNKKFIDTLKTKYKLKTSVNLKLDTSKKIREVVSRFDVDTIIIDRDINRDRDKVKELATTIRELGKTSIVLLNEGCVHDCVFKRDCDNTYYKEFGEQQSFDCYSENFKNRADNYLKSPFMTYEAVEILKKDINIFKISGRYESPIVIEKMIRYYLFNDRKLLLRELLDKTMNKKDDTFFMTLMDMSLWGFTSHVTNCKNDCLNCSYCDNFLTFYKENKDD